MDVALIVSLVVICVLSAYLYQLQKKYRSVNSSLTDLHIKNSLALRRGAVARFYLELILWDELSNSDKYDVKQKGGMLIDYENSISSMLEYDIKHIRFRRGKDFPRYIEHSRPWEADWDTNGYSQEWVRQKHILKQSIVKRSIEEIMWGVWLPETIEGFEGKMNRLGACKADEIRERDSRISLVFDGTPRLLGYDTSFVFAVFSGGAPLLTHISAWIDCREEDAYSRYSEIRVILEMHLGMPSQESVEKDEATFRWSMWKNGGFIVMLKLDLKGRVILSNSSTTDMFRKHTTQ